MIAGELSPAHAQPMESAPHPSALHWLLVASVLVEFVTMRVLLRIGPLLPDEPAWDNIFRLLQTTGLGALNLIIISVMGILLWESAQSVRKGAARRAVAVITSAFAAMLLMLFSLLGMSATSLLVGSLALSVSITVLFALSVGNRRERAFQFLLLLIFLGLTSYYAAKGATGLGIRFPDSAAAYFFVETLAVVAGLAVPLVFRPGRHVKTAALSLLLAALWAAFMWARPWTLATLVMWNTGFSLWLPPPLYAVALGFFVYTVLALAQGGASAQGTAIGLLLIAAAGLKLDYTPYALMALLGYFLITVRSSGALLQGKLAATAEKAEEPTAEHALGVASTR